MNKKDIFLVPQQEEGMLYYNQYDTLEDAVSAEGDGVEVYVATPKFLGNFERSVKVVKLSNKKKKEK